MRRKAYEGVKMYDSLSLGIKQRDRLKIFKRELKEYILNTIRIFLVILIDSVISLFCCVLHFLYFVVLFSLYFVFYISHLKISEKAK